jgi:hypothetical protein
MYLVVGSTYNEMSPKHLKEIEKKYAGDIQKWNGDTSQPWIDRMAADVGALEKKVATFPQRSVSYDPSPSNESLVNGLYAATKQLFESGGPSGANPEIAVKTKDGIQRLTIKPKYAKPQPYGEK